MSPTVTVEDASPSPPPLPAGPIPTEAVDVPIESLGGESDDEEEDEEWDPSEERLPVEAKYKGKGKGKAVDTEPSESGEEPHPWQAVWSAEKNAWYFWNTKTGEVTWTNPLEPPTAAASDAPPLPPGPAPVTASQVPRPQFGQLQEIDPDLAYLLPAEARGGPSDGSSQQALFNARTGRFTANDYRYTVDHLDEYNREKRFNTKYFDQDAWERERMLENAKRKRDEEAGIDTKKPITKKDMERFKKKKQEKRLRSQAWLRD